MRPRPVVLRLFVALFGAASLAGDGGSAEFFTGDYSFSDELGGFRLLGASGSGTLDDPVVISEELTGTDSVTLVIRRHNMQKSDPHPAQSQLTLEKVVTNRSNRVWAGFEVELQEILKEPSTYSDGLSFKQFAAQPKDVFSDAFTMNDRRFEPYDRIVFQGGSVDPGITVRLRLTITDPTPVPEFYLVQDPNLLSVELQTRGRSFAGLECVRRAASGSPPATVPWQC
jgi:hypothetical protein